MPKDSTIVVLPVETKHTTVRICVRRLATSLALTGLDAVALHQSLQPDVLAVLDAPETALLAALLSVMLLTLGHVWFRTIAPLVRHRRQQPF